MSRAPLSVDLTGCVVLVTGANRGMGRATAEELARMGAHVVLGCRSTEQGELVRRAIGEGRASVMPLDLAALDSVRDFARDFGARFEKLDVLINNGAASLQTREVTIDGLERHWATNVVGPHLLTRLLVPPLEASGQGRIVNVSTRAAAGLDLDDTQYERRPFNGVKAYRASKQAVRMLTWALAERLADTRVTANALNPGYVLTDLTKSTGGWLKLLVRLTSFAASSPLEGADTAIWLAASPDVVSATGRFWSRRREIRCRFRDPNAIARLWDLVEVQAGLADDPLRPLENTPIHATTTISSNTPSGTHRIR